MKPFIKAIFCLSAIWFSSYAIGQAQIVVNPDGSHSVVIGNIVVNPNGTHSVIMGNIVVNPNGTHSVLIGDPPANQDGNNTFFRHNSGGEDISYRRSRNLASRSETWFEYRQSRLVRKKNRQKARAARRLLVKGNLVVTEEPR